MAFAIKTLSELDDASDDNDDQSQQFCSREYILQPSCQSHIEAIHKSYETCECTKDSI